MSWNVSESHRSRTGAAESETLPQGRAIHTLPGTSGLEIELHSKGNRECYQQSVALCKYANEIKDSQIIFSKVLVPVAQKFFSQVLIFCNPSITYNQKILFFPVLQGMLVCPSDNQEGTITKKHLAYLSLATTLHSEMSFSKVHLHQSPEGVLNYRLFRLSSISKSVLPGQKLRISSTFPCAVHAADLSTRPGKALSPTRQGIINWASYFHKYPIFCHCRKRKIP